MKENILIAINKHFSPSIILIVPYFGEWPVWFDAFLVSVKHNPTISWLCPTNCDIPSVHPENISFIKTDLTDLNLKVNKVVNANVPLTPRKFCDLKPAYGKIFQEYISEYDFWGFTDLDIIWGNIRKFINNEILTSNDIISSRKNAISGHFTIIRNDEYFNNLFMQIPEYHEKLMVSKIQVCDEFHFTELLKDEVEKNNSKIAIYWPKVLLNEERKIDSHQDYHLDRWLWRNGMVFNTISNKEVMYLHFINWKVTMVKNEVRYEQPVDHFFISYNGIHCKKHSRLQILINQLKNIVFGYWVNDWKRKKKAKLVSFIKRIRSLLNKQINV